MRDLELVRHLARATAATTDVDHVLRLALEVVCDHMGGGAGTVWQPDHDGIWRARHHYRASTADGGEGTAPDEGRDSDLPPVVASMLATETPSSLWRDPDGRRVAAAVVGARGRASAVLQVGLAETEGAQPLLELCETAAELVTQVVERASSEAQLLEAQRLARLGTWQWDVVTDEAVWSDQLFANLGLDPVDPAPSLAEFLELVHPEDREAVHKAAGQALEDLEPFEVTFRVSADEGNQERWLLARGRAVTGADGRPVRMAGTAQDVTERLTLERELAYRASHDVVTGLANRSAYQEQLEQLLATRGAACAAVAVVDLDNFGSMAKRIGGSGGDRLLRAIGERLMTQVEPGAVAGRLVGDEFAVAVIEEQPDPDFAADLGARLQAAFDEPFGVHDDQPRLTASVGVVSTTTGDESADDLLRDAALAVELAKTRGGDRVQVFDPEQHAQALEQLALEADLRQAVDQGDLHVVYQPVVEVSSGAMVSTEALVRWDRPGHRAVSPAVFVPLAERLGLAGRLGSQVLLAACDQLVAWQQEFPGAADLAVAVNLSGLQLDDPNIVETVREALQRSGLAAEHLTLEVTESALPDDAAGALTRLWALRQLGVRIAIDDFGTGYSTLSRLRELPVDVLKVDRSFLADTGRDAPILQALFAMARTLKLSTVAEGVETPAQLLAVMSNHGDHVQGYLFSRPLPPEGIARLLRDPGWDTDGLTTELRATAFADHGESHLDQLVGDFVAAGESGDFERRLRELLAAVAGAIGMDSVYLTRVDLAEQRQDIEVVANPGALEIPEGTSIPWSDSLCREALLAEEQVIHGVSPSHPIGDLDIATFVVAPIRSLQGGLHGTLCAAAAEPREVPASSVALLDRVAALVGEQLMADRGVETDQR